MLKIFRYNKKNSIKSLEVFLNKRKAKQKNKSLSVKKIINDVRKKR